MRTMYNKEIRNVMERELYAYFDKLNLSLGDAIQVLDSYIYIELDADRAGYKFRIPYPEENFSPEDLPFYCASEILKRTFLPKEDDY